MTTDQRLLLEENLGVIWLNDGSGQVFKGKLLDYDPTGELFWICSSCECPSKVDVVVILSNGHSFPSGCSEWCGEARLVSREAVPECQYILCLEAIA